MTLEEFLLARIAEDEERARDWWTQKPDAPAYTAGGFLDPDSVEVDFGGGYPSLMPKEDYYDQYMERAEPDARVIAECEAKRRIVEIHEPYESERVGGPSCWACNRDGWPCETIALLALPYADHPDYREEWRP